MSWDLQGIVEIASDISGKKSVQGTRNSKCKGPEAGICLGNKEVAKRRVAGNAVREKAKARPCVVLPGIAKTLF